MMAMTSRSKIDAMTTASKTKTVPSSDTTKPPTSGAPNTTTGTILMASTITLIASP